MRVLVLICSSASLGGGSRSTPGPPGWPRRGLCIQTRRSPTTPRPSGVCSTASDRPWRTQTRRCVCLHPHWLYLVNACGALREYKTVLDATPVSKQILESRSLYGDRFFLKKFFKTLINTVTRTHLHLQHQCIHITYCFKKDDVSYPDIEVDLLPSAPALWRWCCCVSAAGGPSARGVPGGAAAVRGSLVLLLLAGPRREHPLLRLCAAHWEPRDAPSEAGGVLY